MNTRIENFMICSDIVYPDLISSKRKFKKVRELEEGELLGLIGQLKIGNKYLVLVCGKLLYQHDFKTYEVIGV